MIGEKLKKAIDVSGRERSEVAVAIGISEGNLYKLFKKNSFEVDYLRKASAFLDMPMSYFLDDMTGLNVSSPTADLARKSTPKSDSNYSLASLADKIDSLILQLQAKDQQIEGLQQTNASLQRTLEVLAGKSEGAIRDLLSTEDDDLFIATMNQYRMQGLSLVLKELAGTRNLSVA